MTLQRLLGRIRFRLERLMIRGPHYQLLLVALMIGLISIIGGGLVLMSTGATETFGEATWWAFLRLTDPGYLGDDEGALRRTISTVLTVLGYVVFLGALIAIMTRWLISTMRRLESGVTPIAAVNHIAVVGWTGRTPALVAELLGSEGRVKRFLHRHGARRLHIAILAEHVGPEQVIELRDRAGDAWRPRQVTLRSGSSLRPEHLERIDFLNAAALLIPADDAPQLHLEDVDSRTIKSLLSLGNHPLVQDGRSLPFAAAEVRDARKIPVARQAYAGEIEVIASDATISRLVAQNVRHPGLSHVYNELLTHSEGSAFYIRDPEALAGHTMGSALDAFPNGVLLGVVRPDQRTFVPHLNTPGDFRIEPTDRLVVLTDSYEHAAYGEMSARSTVERSAPGMSRPAGNASQRLLILGWNHQLPALLAEFATYTAESFAVDIMSVSSNVAREQEVERYGSPLGNLTVRHLEGDYNHLPELCAVEPWNYDHIILVGSGRMTTHEDADARSLQGYLLLQHLFAERALDATSRPCVLIELLDPDNFGLLAGRPGELLISPMIVSHMLAQVALRRDLRPVFDELFTAGGAEITFHRAAEYELAGRSATFRDMQRRAWARGETLVGVYQHARHERMHSSKPILNPPRDSTWQLRDDDELVTIVTMK